MDDIDCKLPPLPFNGLQSKTSRSNFIIHSSEEVPHLLYFSAMTYANIHNDYKWKLTQYLPVNWIQKWKPLWPLFTCLLNIKNGVQSAIRTHRVVAEAVVHLSRILWLFGKRGRWLVGWVMLLFYTLGCQKSCYGCAPCLFFFEVRSQALIVPDLLLRGTAWGPFYRVL